MVRGDLGLAPWDVLHSGLTHHFPIDIGQALVIVSFVVMLAWIPLREMPGLGTVSNAIVIGVSADLFLAVLPTPHTIGVRVGFLVAGIALQGLATAAYIGAQFGRGPRDGLMTGLARRTGRSIRLVRTLMELTVVAIGLLLGGVAGIGTILYAVSIGPLSQALLPPLIVAPTAVPTRPVNGLPHRSPIGLISSRLWRRPVRGSLSREVQLMSVDVTSDSGTSTAASRMSSSRATSV